MIQMLSKEKIEKAKDIVKNIICDEVIGTYCVEIQKQNIQCSNNCKNSDCIYTQAMETLLQYIEQLKQENNKQNKIIDLMAGSINNYDSQLDICYFKDKEHVKQHYEEYLEQYFEKKVEEK